MVQQLQAAAMAHRQSLRRRNLPPPPILLAWAERLDLDTTAGGAREPCPCYLNPRFETNERSRREFLKKI